MQIIYKGMPVTFDDNVTQEEANQWISDNIATVDSEVEKFNAKNTTLNDMASNLMGDLLGAKAQAGNVQSDIPSGYLGEPQKPKAEAPMYTDGYVPKNDVEKKVLGFINENKPNEVERVLNTAAANTANIIPELGNLGIELATGKEDMLPTIDTKYVKPQTEAGEFAAEAIPFFSTLGSGMALKAGTKGAQLLKLNPNSKTAKAIKSVFENTGASTVGALANNDISADGGVGDVFVDMATGGVLGAAGGKLVDLTGDAVKGLYSKGKEAFDVVAAGNKETRAAVRESQKAGKDARKYGDDIKDDVVDTINIDSYNSPEGDSALKSILTREDGSSILTPSQVFKSDTKFSKSEKRSIAQDTKQGQAYKDSLEEQVTGKAVREASEGSSLMHPFAKRPDGTSFQARPLNEIMEDISSLKVEVPKGKANPSNVLRKEINAGRFDSPTALRSASVIAKANPEKTYLADELAARGSIEVRTKAIDKATNKGRLDSKTYEAEINKNKEILKDFSDLESGNKPYQSQRQVGQDVEDSLRLMDRSRVQARDTRTSDLIKTALPAIGAANILTGGTGNPYVDALIGGTAYLGKRGLNKAIDRSRGRESARVANRLVQDKDYGLGGDVKRFSDMVKSVKSGNVNETFSPNIANVRNTIDQYAPTGLASFLGRSSSAGSGEQLRTQASQPEEVVSYEYQAPTEVQSVDISERERPAVSGDNGVDPASQLMVKAIVKAETGGMKDPFVFTGGKDPNSTQHSSAYGPGQMTVGLMETYYKGKSDLFTDEEKEWLELAIDQGKIMLNSVSKGNKGGDFTYGGKGDMGDSPRDRELYYAVMGKIVQDIYDESGQDLYKTLRRWRGVDASKDPRWYKEVYNVIDSEE